MNFQDYKSTYHSMPEKWRKHGDMPSLSDMYDDVDAYRQYVFSNLEAV